MPVYYIRWFPDILDPQNGWFDDLEVRQFEESTIYTNILQLHVNDGKPQIRHWTLTCKPRAIINQQMDLYIIYIIYS